MLEIIGLSGIVAFVVASLVVGSRVLLLGARTRMFPETSLGLSLLLAGGLSTALLIAREFIPDIDLGTDYVIQQISSAAGHIGYALLIVFVWRVFRPHETWALAMLVVCIGALFMGAIGMALELEPGGAMAGKYAEGGAWFWLSLSARFAGYGWAATETFRYHGMLKRRLKLGLAEESVVSRFFYWGVCTIAVLCIWINSAVLELFPHSMIVQYSNTLISAILGLIVAGGLSLAFFPMGLRATEPTADAHTADGRSR